MGIFFKILTNFFEEYNIPEEPFIFVCEMIILVVLGVPKVIGSMIGYVYFPPEPKNVEGKVILITGTARGNGRELALQFHRLGAKIVCVDKDQAGNDETVLRIKEEGGRAVGFTVDITDKKRIRTMHEAVKRQMGPVDILVNNAAVVETTSFVNPDADDVISEIVNTNVLGQIWIIREILPSMLERNNGHIVTISSMTSFKGLTFLFAYTATKCALNGMMESLTSELKLMQSKVITTTVCPYFIQNCLESSNRRKLRIPEIPKEVACELMIDGILRNERIFTVPGHCFYATLLTKFLPESLQDMVSSIFFAKIKPTPEEEKNVQKYLRIQEIDEPQVPHEPQISSLFAPCLKMGCLPD